MEIEYNSNMPSIQMEGEPQLVSAGSDQPIIILSAYNTD